jgi:predicted ribosome quality control (RQC) complex YloA/Tae2 family protein
MTEHFTESEIDVKGIPNKNYREESIFIPSLNKNVLFRIGKNAEGNFQIIDLSKCDDLWFHISGVSSAHVIAIVPCFTLDKKQKRDLVKRGAVICKKYSKYASSKDVEIDYTEVKNVKKTNTIGTVTIRDPRVQII